MRSVPVRHRSYFGIFLVGLAWQYHYMKQRISGGAIWGMLKESIKGFGEDKLPKLSGSLAYCTVFSFGPLLIVIIFLSSIFFGLTPTDSFTLCGVSLLMLLVSVVAAYVPARRLLKLDPSVVLRYE